MKVRSAELLIPITAGFGGRKKKKKGSVLALALPCLGLVKKNQGFHMGSCSAGNCGSLGVGSHQQAPCTCMLEMIRAGCSNAVAEPRLPPCSEQLLLSPPLQS